MQAGLVEGIDELAREMGIIKRESKITGRSLVQGLVFGFLEDGQASEVKLAQSVGRAGVSVTSQAVNARLTKQTAQFLQKVLERVAQIVVRPSVKTQSLLDRFSEVNVNDSSVISLPNALSEMWTGCGNRTEHGQAAIKMQVQWDLRSGGLKALTLHNGRDQDRSAPVQTAEVIPNSLRLADLGYFDLSVFAGIGQGQAYWLTRYLSGVNLFTPGGTPIDLVQWLARHCTDAGEVDLPVLAGKQHRLSARLIALRVPQSVADERRRKLRDNARGKGQTVSALSLALAAWSIFLTNVPHDLLSLAEVLIIARTRWQIELLFKLWKSSGRIDESRSRKPYRILCELFAKMIGQIILHWLIIFTCWHFPDRSFTKAAAAIRSCATLLLAALLGSSYAAFADALDMIARSVASTCHVCKRSNKLALFQLLTIDCP